MEIKCKTRQNRILFEGEILSVETPSKFKGEIVVNLINLSMGEGYHIQGDLDAFAFNKVIIADNADTFYIEAHYTKTEKNEFNNVVGTIIPKAFVWRKKK
jgi:hypothetical protein